MSVDRDPSAAEVQEDVEHARLRAEALRRPVTADDGDCFETCQGHPEPVHPILGRPLRHGSPVTADVQRELAEALVAATTDYGSGKADPTVDLFDFYGEALLPTVQALIADAEKRAAAQALEEMAHALDTPAYWPAAKLIRNRAGHIRAALDPSGAAEGAGR